MMKPKNKFVVPRAAASLHHTQMGVILIGIAHELAHNEHTENVGKNTVKQLCPSCNTFFETPYPDHVYCTDTCQRREKGRRRKERRLAGRAHAQQATHDDRFEFIVPNPTDRQLTELCIAVAEDKYNKPILLTGFLPKEYIKPENVAIVEQPKEANQPDKWCLVKRELSALDLLLSSGPQ